MSGRTGRPRSADADRALLRTTRDLVTARGVDAVTIEMIATQAGTGRQTIYRRWPGKIELVLDALLDHAIDEIDTPPPPGDWREAVRTFFVDTFTALNHTGPAMRSLMGHAQRDPHTRDLLLTRLIHPRRESLRSLLTEGITRGDLPPNAPIDTAVTLLYGALWYRLLLAEPLDPPFATDITTLVLSGLTPNPGPFAGTA